MTVESLPSYSVGELNSAIARLLSRGFAPRFLLNASVSKSQLKNGHLWLTLTDGAATISAVAWASTVEKLDFSPGEGEGVVVIGKLNFWVNRASLVVQVINIRPSISTVCRNFEVVRSLLAREGLLNKERQRKLPSFPSSIAILTSVPSSALADMLRTAKERWPLTRVLIIPIPVQGAVAEKIKLVVKKLAKSYKELAITAIVLARGGGSREDLMVFDDEELCRELAKFPIPVVTGLGHEDDLTVSDLVADYRAATPTASIVALLPSLDMAIANCYQQRKRLKDYTSLIIRKERNRLLDLRNDLNKNSPLNIILKFKTNLHQKKKLLEALSPDKVFKRGFCIAKDQYGNILRRVESLSLDEYIRIQLSNGSIDSKITSITSKRD